MYNKKTDVEEPELEMKEENLDEEIDRIKKALDNVLERKQEQEQKQKSVFDDVEKTSKIIQEAHENYQEFEDMIVNKFKNDEELLRNTIKGISSLGIIMYHTFNELLQKKE